MTPADPLGIRAAARLGVDIADTLHLAALRHALAMGEPRVSLIASVIAFAEAATDLLDEVQG